jgi:two-component system, LytTR family, response regulator
MKVIIIDDEPKAIELLRSYLQHFSDFELAGTFRNALTALSFINDNNIDLIFLDINMPHLNGLSFSKMVAPDVKIIFTTAYSEYAVESYEVQALDYLLKPISLERFTKAITKVLGSKTAEEPNADNALLIKSGAKIFRVNPLDILYLVKEGNYITYHTTNQKILARASIAEALVTLPAHFIQCHKSYIVNLEKIDFLDRNELSIHNQLIPIGHSFKEELLKRLEVG